MERDIKQFLEEKSNNIASSWSSDIVSTIEGCKITSPIEQKFYIEWNFQAGYMGDEFMIQPQHIIKVGNKEYRVDFWIYCEVIYQAEETKLSVPDFIVELDSHIWHEKTPEQAEKDKQRERNLVSAGYKIIRFSGREIMKNVEKCVEETRNYGFKLLKEFNKNYFKIKGGDTNSL